MADTSAEQPAGHEVHDRYRSRMKRRVGTTLAVVGAIYFLFLFPQRLPEETLLALGSGWSQWPSFVVGAVANGTLVWVLSFVLFASDSAFKGKSQTAKWTRSLFASRAAIERYRCSEAEASALWFRYFDTWALDRSPNRHLLITSYAATYSGRVVFYLQRALFVFLLLGAVSVVVHWRLFNSYATDESSARLVTHALVLLGFGGGLAFLVLTNRLPKSDRPATGCWWRVQDVFGRSRVVFEREVLQHAEDLQGAFDAVDALRTELTHGEAGEGVAQRADAAQPYRCGGG